MHRAEPLRRHVLHSVYFAVASLALAAPAEVYAQDTNGTAASSSALGTPEQQASVLRQANNILRQRRGEVTWGLGVPLLRLGVLRRPDEPGYTRNFEPELRWLNPQLTFQVTYRPNTAPWRSTDVETGRSTQVISVSGLLIGGLDSVHSLRSEIAIGVSVDFLNGILSVGVGVDLYRGIPVRNGAGEPGGDTVATGIFSWAMTRSGELTVENLFLVLNLGLSAIGETVR